MLTENSCIPKTFPWCLISILYVHVSLRPVTVLLIVFFLFFFPFPHAVPKRALQRDKYGSQTKHCISNVIHFGFTFFPLSADKGVMKKRKKNLLPFGSSSSLLWEISSPFQTGNRFQSRPECYSLLQFAPLDVKEKTSGICCFSHANIHQAILLSRCDSPKIWCDTWVPFQRLLNTQAFVHTRSPICSDQANTFS